MNRKLFTYLLFILFTGYCSVEFSQSQTIIEYSTPGTYNWTCPAGVTSITVECWGAGGGGGIISGSGGGGGGGGAYARGNNITVTPGNNYTIVIGTGGAPDIAGGGGTRTSFDVLVIADYGRGATTASGAAGGTVANSVGTVRYAGGNGGNGNNTGDTGGGGGGSGGLHGNGVAGAAATNSVGGNGGNGDNNSGGAGGTGGNTTNGNPGISHFLGGGGGGGGDDGLNGASAGGPGGGGGGGEINGGTGADGKCIISYYCTPDFPTGVYSITRVQFGSIDNSSASISGGTVPDWENFTYITTNVTQGNTYPITVTARGLGTANIFYINAFFDWNNDGDFSDSWEQYNLGTHNDVSSIGVVSGNIYVPDWAAVGTIRMRVVNRFSAYSTPCNLTGYGQAEDYSAVVPPLTNCSGTPVAGTVNPAVSNITTADNLNLTWSETPQNGNTYQWQTQDGFGMWINIPGATSYSYNASGLTEGTHLFRVIVTCTTSGLSNTSSSAQVNVVVGYCNPGNLDCSLNDYVSRVQLNTLDNTSGTTCISITGYSDYSALAPTDLTLGSSYNLSITVGAGTGSHSAGVWIDFNRNGSFLDAGEYFSIAQGTILPSSTTTVSILIPTTASTGNTRMRIQYAYGAAVLSSWTCFTNATYGETEDYTVNLVCSAVPSDITGRFPSNGLSLPCGSAIGLSWDEHGCASGYKIYLGTTNPPVTLVDDIAGSYYYTGNLNSNTTYYWKVVPYSGSGDGTGTVWSFNTQTAIVAAVSSDEAGCTDGGLCLDASGGAFPDYYWYDVPSGGVPVASGTTYCPTGLTGTTTFYVANYFDGTPTSINASATTNAECSATDPGFGVFFDIKAKSANIIVTSIDVMFRDNGQVPAGGINNRPVKVYYYATQSYQGHTNSSTGWTLLDNLSIPVPNAPSAVTNIDITDIYVPAGTTYGIYVVYDCVVRTSPGIFANSDLELKTGSIACGGEFTDVYPDVSFRGTVYYQINCSSPTYPVIATPYVSNNYVALAGSSVSGLVEQCTEYGWTYYSQPATPNIWLFAIKKNGNTFTATVDITKGAGVYQNVNASTSAGSFLLERYWNITLTSGSIDPAFPVSVRLFFNSSEIADAVTLRNTIQAGYPGTFPTAWRWFKSVGVPFDPSSNIDGNTFNFTNVTLTTTGALTESGASYSGTINGVPYVDLDGITSFSGGTGGVGFSKWPTALLPIELLNFSAELKNNLALLKWSTLSEINNDFFEIQKSTDLNLWYPIGIVNGAGNSSTVTDYSFMDIDPIESKTYYKLKQVDFDGNYSYTYIVNVTPDFFILSPELLSVYIEKSDKIVVSLKFAFEQKYSLSIIDINGINAYNATGIAESDNEIFEIPASSLANGIYFIKVVLNNSILTNKIIIVR